VNGTIENGNEEENKKMGFFKELGEVVGTVAGAIVSAPIYVVGEVVDSDFIKDVAEATYKVTAHTGSLAGDIAEGTGKCVGGIIRQDGSAVGEGLGQVLEAGVNTVVGMGKGVAHVASQGIDTACAIANGDVETAIKTGKEVAKVALVGTFAVGVGDLIEGVTDLEDQDYVLMENEDTHYVSPHWRTLPSGERIWVDGDGNTSIHRDYGWSQSNPDYRVKG